MVIYNYVSCDLTLVTRDSKSSYKSSDSRMLNSGIYVCTKKEMLLKKMYMCHTFYKNAISRNWCVTFRILGIIYDQPYEF